MSSTTRKAGRTALVLWLATGLFAVNTALAQSPTPEGTVITNIAVVNWTDANGNSYAPDSASVSVTVGFAAGIDVIAAEASVSVDVAARDTINFDIANIGNGTDSVTISENVTNPSVITINGYIFNGSSYTWAQLTAIIDTLDLAQDDTITIGVDYTVNAGQGGNSANYQLTAQSQRDAGTSDQDDTDINVNESLAVAVTEDGADTLQHLPSNGTQYTYTFRVTNNGDGSETFGLKAFANPGAAIASIVSVNGDAAPGDTTDITLAAGDFLDVDVVYTIADVAAGTTDSLFLRATAASDGNVNDTGYAFIEVIRPALTISKQAWNSGRTAQISADVLPGDTIWYRIEVSNTGDAQADTAVVTDVLPSQVTYLSTDDPDSSWDSIAYDGPSTTVTATRNTLAAAGSDLFWIQVEVK